MDDPRNVRSQGVDPPFATGPSSALKLRGGRWLWALTTLLFAIALLVGIGGAMAGWAGTVHALGSLSPTLVLAGLVLTLLHLLLRAARWHWLLLLRGHRLPVWQQLRIYLAGLALSSTPGKVGESWRSLLLLPHGVRVSTSLGSWVADRGSDVIGLALLGALGGVLSGGRSMALEAVAGLGAVLSMAAAALLRRPAVQDALATRADPGRGLGTAPRRWLGRLRMADLLAPVLAWARLWTPRRAACMVLVAMGAYALQAGILWLHAASFAPQLDGWSCARVFAVAVLIGAASMMPGGLGATDTALVVQLHALGLDLSQAVAVTLVTRASTLGFAWVLGVGALASWSLANRYVRHAHKEALMEPRIP